MDAVLNDLRSELWLRLREKNEIVWTTKEGKRIPINKMTDTHLINTIKMLEKEVDIMEHLGDFDAIIDLD